MNTSFRTLGCMPHRMLWTAIVALSSAPLLCAQQPMSAAMMSPPKVLSIEREYVKPGKSSAHGKIESQFAHAFAQAKVDARYLAMTSVTGPDEAWFVSGYDSFADLEKMDNSVMQNASVLSVFDRLGSQDGDLLSGSDRLIGYYREDLSYHPESPDSLADKRYFDVEIVRVRPGHVHDYEEMIKLFKTASDKVGTTDHFEGFEIVSGASEGTFLFFAGRKSLAIYDQFDQMYGKKFDDALGEDGRKKMRELEGASVEKAEDRLYAFSPRMSYPPDTWIKADPGFWQPRPMAKPAASGMKMSKKKSAVSPPPAQ